MSFDHDHEQRIAAHAERVSADLGHDDDEPGAWWLPADPRQLATFFAPRPRCRECGGAGKTYSSRQSDDGNTLTRYTECTRCRSRWKIVMS